MYTYIYTHTFIHIYTDREDASCMVSSGATANTTEGNIGVVLFTFTDGL